MTLLWFGAIGMYGAMPDWVLAVGVLGMFGGAGVLVRTLVLATDAMERMYERWVRRLG